MRFIAKGSNKIHIQANQIILISGLIASICAALIDWLLGFFVIGMSFWMMSTYELLGKKSYKQYALVNIGARGTQLILSIMLYYFIGVPGIVIGFAISFLMFSHRYYLSIKEFTRDFNEIKEKMKFSLHTYSFNLSNALLMYSDKIIIAPLFGYTILGYYQLGFQFLMFLGMIPISFFQYLIPEESSGQKKTKLKILGFILSLAITGLFILISPSIVYSLFPHYIQSIDSIKILSLGLIPMTITYIFNSGFLTEGRTRGVIIGSVIYQILQLVLIITLGNELKITGLAIAIVLSLSGQALFLFIYRSWNRKKHLLLPNK